MKTVIRIQIQGQEGNCGDTAYKFVTEVLKRGYGNAVTFALEHEADSILNQIREAGFQAYFDGYDWPIMEPSDYRVGNVVTHINSFAMRTELKIVELLEDAQNGLIAKVKYVSYPRKKAFWVKAQTQESYIKEVKEALDRYDNGLDVMAVLGLNPQHSHA